MYNERHLQGNFIKIVKEIGKEFPELRLKTKISKKSVKILTPPCELYSSSVNTILRLTQEIQESLNFFPDSPLIDHLESNNAKLRKVLLMLAFARKDMFS